MNFAKEITGLPGLMKTSAEQLRKVPALTGTAMLTALNVVVGTLFIPITPTLRIGFSSIPAAVCGMYYGPICTGFAGVIADTLKYIIRPDGPYFPGFAVNEFLTGMIYGCFFYKKKLTIWRVLAAKFVVMLICNVILNTLCLQVLYGQAFMAILPMRALKNLIMWPIDSIVFFGIAKALEQIGLFRTFRKQELVKNA